MWVSLIAPALALVAGCATPDEEPAPFVPPTAGDYPAGARAECPPPGSRSSDVRFEVRAGDAPPGAGENVARVDLATADALRPEFEWRWRVVDAGERPDRLTRAATFALHRAPDGTRVVCATFDVVSADETTAPAEAARQLVVAGRPVEPLPAGDYEFVANWNLGCPWCGRILQGNATARAVLGP